MRLQCTMFGGAVIREEVAEAKGAEDRKRKETSEINASASIDAQLSFSLRV